MIDTAAANGVAERRRAAVSIQGTKRQRTRWLPAPGILGFTAGDTRDALRSVKVSNAATTSTWQIAGDLRGSVDDTDQSVMAITRRQRPIRGWTHARLWWVWRRSPTDSWNRVDVRRVPVATLVKFCNR